MPANSGDMDMKSITLQNPGKLAFSEINEPSPPAPGEAQVRVHRVGVCGTDYHAYRGRQPFFTYPRILGHELGVEIMSLNETDNPSGLQPGDKCCVEPYINCGKCIACRRGRTNCCTSLKTLGVHTDGGMRGIINVPIRKLHSSKVLNLDQLALVETLGIGAHAVDRAQLQEGETVLVVGAGPIGLSVIQFAQLAKVKLIVMDVSTQRLMFCNNQFHVSQTIQAANAEKAFEELKVATNNELPTAVFDATGNANSMMNAFRFTAHSGRLILVGLVLGEITFNDPDFHRRELTVMSSRNSTHKDFKHIIALTEAGKVDSSRWITHRASAENMITEFEKWTKPDTGCVKAIVEFA